MNHALPNSRPLALAAALAMSLLMLLTAGCERIAPIRTLPSWVRGVYIPVFKNKTYEPQIEEDATRYTQETFLRDGRVDIVPKKDADVVVMVEIMAWNGRASGNSGEHIVNRESQTVTASVKLYEPFATEPLVDLGKVNVRADFYIDTRSTEYTDEPTRKEILLRALADQILFRTINGFPVNLKNLPAGTLVPEFKNPESISTGDILSPRPEKGHY